MTTEEKCVAKSVIDSHASYGVVRNVISVRTGYNVSRQACVYLGTLGNDLKRLAGLSELSSSDKLINFLKEKNHDYITLFNSMNKFPNQTVLTSDNYLSSKRIFSNTNFIIPPNEQKDANDYAISNRNNRKLSDEQNLLVAVAWVIKSERRLFDLFPETVFVDCVEDTNNEGRPLLTMTGCDSDGKMFTFLRALLPNQRTWGFRWIFSHVLPTMFGSDTLKKINIIMSDGDSKEYTQIDSAIHLYASNITRVRCAWHAIDRGWVNHGPKCLNKKNIKEYREIVYNCKHWLYSWTKPSIESEVEYIISKQLFEKYIFSNDVLKITGSTFPKIVLDFIRINLEPVLPNMLFYKRRHIRHFDQNMNTKHEGTFKGIKYGATPVTPSMSLHNSLCLLSNVAERKCGQIRKNKTDDVLKKKTWISLPCGDKLNLRGEQLLTSQWKLRGSYKNHRVASNKWLVTFDDKDNHTNNNLKTLYPLFKRVREVTCNCKYFFCTCKYFERFGIPCRHILCVFASFPKYKYPTHNDVSVIYWKQYMHYAYNSSNSYTFSNDVADMLLLLRNNNILGPTCPEDYYKDSFTPSTVPNTFVLKEITCRNHDISNLSNHQLLYVPSGYGVSMSQSLLSQESNMDTILNEKIDCNHSISSNDNCSDIVIDDPTNKESLLELNNSF